MDTSDDEEEVPPASQPLLHDLQEIEERRRDEESSSPHHHHLSRPLWLLYCLNGVTLALPMTALLYIVNTRVSMPLSLIPTYGALSFLPNSLKPLYAYLDTVLPLPRHAAISILLLLTCFSWSATALIPMNGGVVWCFVLGFLRDFFTAWPELLLGLTLLDDAYKATTTTTTTNHEDEYSTTVSRFQAQAATARNVGSFGAHVAATVFLAVLPPPPQSEMTRFSANTLLVTAGLCNILGAMIAFGNQVGTTTASDPTTTTLVVVGAAANTSRVEGPTTTTTAQSSITHLSSRTPSYDSSSSSSSDDDDDDDEEPPESSQRLFLPLQTLSSSAGQRLRSSPQVETTVAAAATANTKSVIMVILFQVALVVLALKQPIVDVTSQTVWTTLMILCCGSILAVGGYLLLAPWWCWRAENRNSPPSSSSWLPAHGVALFLILRHATPSSSYLISSYVYGIFETQHPAVLQGLTMISMSLLTVASWTYGRLWSPWSKGSNLYWVIAATTTLAAAVGLSELLLVKVVPHQTFWIQVLVTVMVKMMTTFVGEWMFLPDVVLASVAATLATKVDCCSGATDQSTTTTTTNGDTHTRVESEDSFAPAVPPSARTSRETDPLSAFPSTAAEQPPPARRSQVSIQYGALMSCINFGDQIGTLLAGPLVSLLQVSRQNDWANLDKLIEIGCLSTLASILFVGILIKSGFSDTRLA